MKPGRHGWPDLGVLSALGFGPEAALMNEPKLFVDRRFLAALLCQLEDELGAQGCRDALFQIGLLHGLRDAQRVMERAFHPCADEDGPGEAAATPLAIRFGADAGGVACERPLRGGWPESYEADARLSRLGPSDGCACALSSGYTSGWLSGTLGSDVVAVEVECLASGHSACRFEAREAGAWVETGEAEAQALIAAIDFDVFRSVAAQPGGPPVQPGGSAALEIDPRTARPAPTPDDFADFDGDASVVHVWGPVMVMPFLGAEEAVEGIEILSRDPTADAVRVVILDLREALIKDGYEERALSQVIGVIESWGADTILSGVSPLSEEAVRRVEEAHLVLRRELPDAIAAAFQIADVQRHVV